MTRAERRLERIIVRAGDEAFALLQAEAQRVLDASPRYSLFIAAMGVCSFYDLRGHPVDSWKLTRRASRVVDLGDQITTTFGSPGYELKPSH